MHTRISFLIGIVSAAVVVGLRVLVAENEQGEHFTFPGCYVPRRQGLAYGRGRGVGFLLAFLVLIPGQLASAGHRWTVGRQTVALEDRLRALLEEHQPVMQQVLLLAAS